MTNYKKKNNMIHWKHNTILCTGYHCTILINGRRIFVVTFSHYCCIIMNLHINKWINKHLFTNLTHTGLDWVIGVYFTFQHFVSFIATTQLTGPGQKTTTTMHLPNCIPRWNRAVHLPHCIPRGNRAVHPSAGYEPKPLVQRNTDSLIIITNYLHIYNSNCDTQLARRTKG